MKQIIDLMPLATLEDLRGFCQDYARKDKKFNKELTAFLNERFIDDEDSAADFIARLEDAFSEEKNIGDRWHSYYVTDWSEIYSVSTDVLKDARRKIALLEKMGRKDGVAKATAEYLHLPKVRKVEIQKAIERRDFQQAITLIKGGQELAEKENRGIVEWKELELDVYRRTLNWPMQAQLCRELFVLERGSMDYYRELRKLTDSKEWKPFLAKLLSDTKMHVGYSSSIEADIYVEEQDWEHLFALLMDGNHHTPDMFDSYANHLKSTHSAELLAEYVTILKDYAARNMGAKHYSRIRQSMEAMLKLENGKAAAHQLADHFREAYRRRPSFMDEISKF